MSDSPIILVKIGGSTLGAGDTSLADLARLQADGFRPIVVHGGGAMITDWMGRLGVRAQFVDGLRVTDAESIEVVAAVLAGVVNKSLVRELAAAGANAVGVSGADGGALTGHVDNPALGYVASRVTVDPALLLSLVDGGAVPVVAPLALGTSEERALLNVNADTAAGAIAVAVRAERLVFLTDVDGVLDSSGRLLKRIPHGQGSALVDSGIVKGGMIPKMRACLEAAEAGLSANIINGTVPGALLHCMEGSTTGTLVL